jgi:hypothetical protein
MVKLKHKYIFPNIMASMMKNIDMKTQLEASMMSMFLLLVGMVLMSVYTFIYLTQGLVFKILLVFNLLAGFIFMSSFLVTTFQQYISFMDAIDLQGNVNLNPLASGNQVPNIPRKKNRVNQFLFFVGFLIIVAGIVLLSWNPQEIRTKYWMYITGGMIFGFLMMISVFFRKNKTPDPVKQEIKEDQEKQRLDEIRKLNNLLKYKLKKHKELMTGKSSQSPPPIKPNKYISPEEEEFYR